MRTLWVSQFQPFEAPKASLQPKCCLSPSFFSFLLQSYLQFIQVISYFPVKSCNYFSCDGIFAGVSKPAASYRSSSDVEDADYNVEPHFINAVFWTSGNPTMLTANSQGKKKYWYSQPKR